MKKLLALVGLVCFTLIVTAQNPMSRRNGQGGQMPAGRLYGKVVDVTNKGIEAASVTLVASRMDSATRKMKENIVGGMLTTKTGDFIIENVPLFGRYKLKISGIGFKPYEQPVGFDMPNRDAMGADPMALAGALDKDLGNIRLEVDEKVLGSVTVTASRPAMTLAIDRKVFNVDKNITSAGGTAVDVMRNVPSVNVDIDGNVSLRNTSPTLFVDGRPTNLTLDQIPADAIESVEVITNPSAKFDASGGTAGILNIVMKKNRRVGYSGNVRANVDSRAKVGAGGDINIRQNKVNFFASGMYNQRKSIGSGFTDRSTTGRNDTSFTSLQRDRSVFEGEFGFGRFGIDYFMDIRNTLTITGSFARGAMNPLTNSSIEIDTFYRNNILVNEELQKRFSNSDNLFRNKGAQVSYKHNFPKSGHEWTADVTYNKGINENFNTIYTDFFNTTGGSLKDRYHQNQTGRGSNENLTLQTDYANPLSATTKIEFGALAQMRDISSENTVVVAGKTNPILYNSKDHVYAAYTTFSNRIKNFGYQLGLRLESSFYEGNLPNKGQSFTINFPVSLFPSVFLTQRLSDDDELQFNFSRRINRPNFFQLFPFTDYSDSLNITRGNPGLNPEFTNSLELSFSKTFKNRDNILASVYFKNTNNLITRLQQLELDTFLRKNVVVNSYENANSSYITGVELTGRNKITKWWDMTTNVNFFTSRIDLENQPDPDQFVSYFIKWNHTFRLPKNLSFQLSGDYQSKIISAPGGGGGGRMFGGGGGHFFGGGMTAAQGFIRPNYGVDAALRYEFLKNKAASLSLNVNDVFRTKLFNSYTQTPFFTQDMQRRRDPQVFRLNFNYRFGKFDASLFKRKNNRAESGVDMGNMNF